MQKCESIIFISTFLFRLRWIMQATVREDDNIGPSVEIIVFRVFNYTKIKMSNGFGLLIIKKKNYQKKALTVQKMIFRASMLGRPKAPAGHSLRINTEGRVGRGSHQPNALTFAEVKNVEVKSRVHRDHQVLFHWALTLVPALKAVNNSEAVPAWVVLFFFSTNLSSFLHLPTSELRARWGGEEGEEAQRKRSRSSH